MSELPRRSDCAKDDYDGLPPANLIWPTEAQEEFYQAVDRIAFEFAKCARAPNPWWIFSHACLELESLVSRRSIQERLAPVQRDRLGASILGARFAMSAYTAPHMRDSLSEGFDGLFVLGNHLAESDEVRAARHPDVLRDARDRVRIVRNQAHNECLAQAIAERARQRRAVQADAIICEALLHVPLPVDRKVA